MSISRAMARVRAASQHGARGRSQETIENREDRVRQDLTRRIKCVCADLTMMDFEALITAMTREQLRGEGISGRTLWLLGQREP
jgi:thioester reductase-like protein